MKKLFYYSLLTIHCSLIFACTSRIEIITDDAEPRLVIFGAVSDNLQKHSVKISCSTGYFSEEEPPIIDNAVVTISSGNEIFNLNYLDSGRYFTDSMRFEYGKIYTLDVYLDFDNDGTVEHYQAKSRMPRGPRVDSIMLVDEIYSEKLNAIVKLDMPMLLLFGEVYKDVYNTFCIYTGKNNEPQGLFDYYMMMSEDFIKTEFGVFTLPYWVKGGIEIGDTVNCRIDDLPNEYINDWSNAYASFLSQCNSEAGIKMPFFSSPPAEVITNIVCLDADIKVSGFFAVFDRGEDLTTISKINFKFGRN